MTRYDELVRMGFKPSRAQVARLRKTWNLIDDSLPPEGDPDGSFRSFQEWVSKAESWIGGTGAKCFDAKDRRCRIGADMQRARDKGGRSLSGGTCLTGFQHRPLSRYDASGKVGLSSKMGSRRPS